MDVTGIGGFGGVRMDPAQFAQKRFEKLDANADGGIDKSEFAAVTERTGLDVEEVFSQYDTNGDGKLDATEEAKAFEAHKEQNSMDSKDALQALVKDAFQVLMAILQQTQEQNANQGQDKDAERFARLDADSDGGIDKAEFAAVAEKTGLDVDDVFAQYDANEDGKLDETEEAASFEGFQAQHARGQSESDSQIQTLLDMLKNEEEEDETYQELLASLMQNGTTRYGSAATIQVNQTVNVFNVQA